jgi:hypothetical protein
VTVEKVELAADTTNLRSASAKASPLLLASKRQTKKGKARLVTLETLDGRTAAAREARRLIAALSADLGGDDQLSAGERQLVTRAALVGAIVTDFEARWVAGENMPLADYLSAVNVQRRVLATLGLQRRSRDVSSMSLRERWAQEFAEESEDTGEARGGPTGVIDAEAVSDSPQSEECTTGQTPARGGPS